MPNQPKWITADELDELESLLNIKGQGGIVIRKLPNRNGKDIMIRLIAEVRRLRLGLEHIEQQTNEIEIEESARELLED